MQPGAPKAPAWDGTESTHIDGRIDDGEVVLQIFWEACEKCNASRGWSVVTGLNLETGRAKYSDHGVTTTPEFLLDGTEDGRYLSSLEIRDVGFQHLPRQTLTEDIGRRRRGSDQTRHPFTAEGRIIAQNVAGAGAWNQVLLGRGANDESALRCKLE